FFKADRLRQLSIMFQMERPALSFQLLKNSRKLCRLLLRIPASKFRADVPEIQCQIFSIAYNPVRADPASSKNFLDPDNIFKYGRILNGKFLSFFGFRNIKPLYKTETVSLAVRNP